MLSWATHALAPVVCFLSFEIEMGVLRSHFRQRDNSSKLSEPDTNVKPGVRDVVNPVINVPRENVRNNINETKQDIRDRTQKLQ